MGIYLLPFTSSRSHAKFGCWPTTQPASFLLRLLRMDHAYHSFFSRFFQTVYPICIFMASMLVLAGADRFGPNRCELCKADRSWRLTVLQISQCLILVTLHLPFTRTRDHGACTQSHTVRVESGYWSSATNCFTLCPKAEK